MDDLEVSALAGGAEAEEPIVAADVPGVKNDSKLLRYWVYGKGALKIRWGQPHDFDRCVRQLRKYSKGGAAFSPEGLCNRYHRRALGVAPGQEHKKAHTAINPDFERLHPRRLGRFAHKGGGDMLGLSGRIQLGDGEQLTGSAQFAHVDGDVPVAAWTQGPRGTKLRLGLIPEEDVPRWGANPKGGTVELDEAQAVELRKQLGGMLDMVGTMLPEAGARQAELMGRRNRLMSRTVGPNRERIPLSDADAADLADVDAQLDALAADTASWPAMEGTLSTPWGDLDYAVLDDDDHPYVVLGIGDRRTAMTADEAEDLLDSAEPGPTTAALGQDNNPEFNRVHFRDPGGLFASKPGARILAGVATPDQVVLRKEHEDLYGEEYDGKLAFEGDRIADTDFGRSHGLGKTNRGLFVSLYGHSEDGVEGQVFFDVGDGEHVLVAMDGLSPDDMRDLSAAMGDMYNDDVEEEFAEYAADYPDMEIDPGETVLDEMPVLDGYRIQRLGDGDLNIVNDETDEDVLFVPMGDVAAFQEALEEMADSLDAIQSDAEGAAQEATTAAAAPLPDEMWHAVAHIEGLSTGARVWEPGALTWREPPFAFHTELQSSAHGSPMTTVQTGLVTRMARLGDEVHAWGTLDLDSDAGLECGRRIAQRFARWVSMDPDEQPVAYEVVMPADATGMDVRPEQVVFHRYNIAGLTSVSMPAQEGSYLEPLPALLEALAERGVPVLEVTVAAAVAPHETATSDDEWDADVNVGRLPSPMSVETARNVFAWIDDSRIEDDMIVKDGCKFPHHLVSEDGTPGAADLAACSAVIAALNGARSEPDIPDADREGVYRHVAAHLRDAGREDIPELQGPTTAAAVSLCTCMGQDGEPIHPGPCDFKHVAAQAARRAAQGAPHAHADGPGGSRLGKLRKLLADHTRDLPAGNRLAWSGADRRRAIALEKAIKVEELKGELADLAKGEAKSRISWPRKKRLRAREIDDELEKLAPTARETKVMVASAAHVLELPDLPPAEWFEEPVELDAEPGGPIRITDEGRIYGWLVPEDIAHRSYARRGERKTFTSLGKIDFSRWLGETIVAGGKRVLAGPVTMDCDHAPTSGYGQLAARNQHYENTCSIVGRVNTGVGTRHKGQWIAGALMPWITAQQFTNILVSRMSGDWQPHPERDGWQEFVAALVVPVGGWPGSRTSITTAGATYAIEESEDCAMVTSCTVPFASGCGEVVTAAGCGCYVIDDDADEDEEWDDEDDEAMVDADGEDEESRLYVDPRVLDMYTRPLGLDRRSRFGKYAQMIG